MYQPPGFTYPGQENKVCKLKKSLYGLKQSPRGWYDRINSALKGIGLNRSTSDSNLYYKHEHGHTIILLLYVDNLFITGSCEKRIRKLKNFLHVEFDITDLGHVKRYLGITFDTTKLGILLH